MTISKIIDIQANKEQLTHDISCSGDSLFYANGILTHNSGANDKSPDMTATSESWGVPASLDWFIAITTDEVLQENSQQLIHPLKTRWGNKSKLKSQIVNIDFDKMRYTDAGSRQEIISKVSTQDKAREKLNTKRRTEGIDFNVE